MSARLERISIPLAIRRPSDAAIASALAVLALLSGLANAWSEVRQATLPLDLDGYGVLVREMAASGRSLSALFGEPSLWKGPVVPFVFGLAYFIAPFETAPLAFNAVWFSVAAALFFVTFRRLGASPGAAAAAVALWVFYPPHAYVFGYYYSEPFLSFLVAATSFVFVTVIRQPTAVGALALGGLGALLLLARAPFALAIAALAGLLWIWLPAPRPRWFGLFVIGGALTFLPWPVRNLVVHDALIPFTTEGGKILFQGVWLPGDDAFFADLRRMPEWNRFEAGERGLSPPEQYAYWQRLAIDQIGADPAGQLRLVVRKALRFWVYLPQYSWTPAWKTTAAALVILPLAIVGGLARRRSLLAGLCIAWVGGLWLFHALVHSELRYNFPVLPLAFVLAAVGAADLWSRLQRRRAGVRVEVR